MSLIILFGLPAAGKTYTAKFFSQYFGYHFYEGDNDLTEEMMFAIQTQATITNKMRDRFFEKIIDHLNTLHNYHTKIVLAQTFIKEKYRLKILKYFPQAKFILISADDNIRELRLDKRSEFPLDKTYAQKMIPNFDTPKISHQILLNNVDGESAILSQLRNLF
ncbi:hypothetical protein HYT02_02320 [Candidatus Gottesmanbacteria bacterium]|nr:hypothetical protein [Candidatus Gottesmanbacteria bacterium]